MSVPRQGTKRHEYLVKTAFNCAHLITLYCKMKVNIMILLLEEKEISLNFTYICISL
jgi:hypothetical protein